MSHTHVPASPATDSHLALDKVLYLTRPLDTPGVGVGRVPRKASRRDWHLNGASMGKRL